MAHRQRGPVIHPQRRGDTESSLSVLSLLLEANGVASILNLRSAWGDVFIRKRNR